MTNDYLEFEIYHLTLSRYHTTRITRISHNKLVITNDCHTSGAATCGPFIVRMWSLNQ
ncbi:hypothetical protein HanRHA438_Chr02g0050181 [Helianthus annuus]|nr:hypothetical protein HanRHA438_Chr02g0050181 [Helianthus annuus]